MKKIFFMIIAGCSIAAAQSPNTGTGSTDNTHGEMATLWFQQSAEARALFYQTYQLAALRLDQYLARPRGPKPPAVVTDVDETVLDNSPYQAWTIHQKRAYPERWKEWIDRAEAAPLPGALEFFQYAASKGVEVFYITNRAADERAGTVKNLKKMSFPFADTAHVLVKTAESSKQKRRNSVLERFDVVLYCGDNLNDLDEFTRMSNTERNQKTEKLKEKFGTTMIVFPNPMYGDWEGAAYEYQYGISDSAKSAKRRSALKGF